VGIQFRSALSGISTWYNRMRSFSLENEWNVNDFGSEKPEEQMVEKA
jgi:hypothetical protein